MRLFRNLSTTLKRKIGSKSFSSGPFYSGLSKDLLSMLHDTKYDKYDYDVVIKTGDNKELRAHSNILKARSLYFKNVISNKRYEFGKYHIDESNIRPTVFELILE